MRICNLCFECLEVILNPKQLWACFFKTLIHWRTNWWERTWNYGFRQSLNHANSFLTLAFFPLSRNFSINQKHFAPDFFSWGVKIHTFFIRIFTSWFCRAKNIYFIPLHFYVDWWRCKSLTPTSTWSKKKIRNFSGVNNSLSIVNAL